MSRLRADFAGGGGAGFLCVAGGGQFLSEVSRLTALPASGLLAERVTSGGFLFVPVGISSCLKSSNLRWRGAGKKPELSAKIFPWPRGPRSAPSSRLPSRVSGHYCRGTQGGAVCALHLRAEGPWAIFNIFFLSLFRAGYSY